MVHEAVLLDLSPTSGISLIDPKADLIQSFLVNEWMKLLSLVRTALQPKVLGYYFSSMMFYVVTLAMQHYQGS